MAKSVELLLIFLLSKVVTSDDVSADYIKTLEQNLAAKENEVKKAQAHYKHNREFFSNKIQLKNKDIGLLEDKIKELERQLKSKELKYNSVHQQQQVEQLKAEGNDYVDRLKQCDAEQHQLKLENDRVLIALEDAKNSNAPADLVQLNNTIIQLTYDLKESEKAKHSELANVESGLRQCKMDRTAQEGNAKALRKTVAELKTKGKKNAKIAREAADKIQELQDMFDQCHLNQRECESQIGNAHATVQENYLKSREREKRIEKELSAAKGACTAEKESLQNEITNLKHAKETITKSNDVKTQATAKVESHLRQCRMDRTTQAEKSKAIRQAVTDLKKRGKRNARIARKATEKIQKLQDRLKQCHVDQTECEKQIEKAQTTLQDNFRKSREREKTKEKDFVKDKMACDGEKEDIKKEINELKHAKQQTRIQLDVCHANMEQRTSEFTELEEKYNNQKNKTASVEASKGHYHKQFVTCKLQKQSFKILRWYVQKKAAALSDKLEQSQGELQQAKVLHTSAKETIKDLKLEVVDANTNKRDYQSWHSDVLQKFKKCLKAKGTAYQEQRVCVHAREDLETELEKFSNDLHVFRLSTVCLLGLVALLSLGKVYRFMLGTNKSPNNICVESNPEAAKEVTSKKKKYFPGNKKNQ